MQTLLFHFLFCGEQNFPKRKLWFLSCCTTCTSPDTIIRSSPQSVHNNFVRTFELDFLNRFVRAQFQFFFFFWSTSEKAKTIYGSNRFLWEFWDREQTRVSVGWAVFDVQDWLSGAEVEFIWNVRTPEAWAHLQQTFLETRCLPKAFSWPAHWNRRLTFFLFCFVVVFF